jgi:hypothetical protein
MVKESWGGVVMVVVVSQWVECHCTYKLVKMGVVGVVQTLTQLGWNTHLIPLVFSVPGPFPHQDWSFRLELVLVIQLVILVNISVHLLVTNVLTSLYMVCRVVWLV